MPIPASPAQKAAAPQVAPGSAANKPSAKAADSGVPASSSSPTISKNRIKMVIPEIPPFGGPKKAQIAIKKPDPIVIEKTADVPVPVSQAKDEDAPAKDASAVLSPAAANAKLNPGASSFVFKPNPKAETFKPVG